MAFSLTSISSSWKFCWLANWSATDCLKKNLTQWSFIWSLPRSNQMQWYSSPHARLLSAFMSTFHKEFLSVSASVKQGSVFPETFMARASLPKIFQFCHMGNIVSTSVFVSNMQIFLPLHCREYFNESPSVVAVAKILLAFLREQVSMHSSLF